MLITAVRFKVCPWCGEHGKICFVNSKRSVDIFDKESALKILEDANTRGWVTEEEILFLIDQIQDSTLPETREEVVSLMDLLEKVIGQVDFWEYKDKTEKAARRTSSLSPNTTIY